MITDTPFQILKMTGYAKFLQDTTGEHTSSQKRKGKPPLLKSSPTHRGTIPTGAQSSDGETQIQIEDWIRQLIEGTLRSLLYQLDELDKRKACAWPHKREDGVNIFRLDDHFWLWQSLHEVRTLGLWKDKVEESGGSKERAAFEEPTRWLLPDNIQRAVLQRFSSDNDVLRTKMLAVTRSPRETRYLFHSRDTALFYGHRLSFFSQDEATKTLWESTVESQARHDGLDLEDNLRKTLRYALGVLAGLVGVESWSTTSSKKDPKKWAQHCLGLLVEASTQSGLSPGYVGERWLDRLRRRRRPDNRDYEYQ